MRMISVAITVCIALAGASSVQAEEGPCQERNLRQKVACLNVFVGRQRDLPKRVEILETEVKELRRLTEAAIKAANEAKAIAERAKAAADEAKQAADAAKGQAANAIQNGDFVQVQSRYSAIKKCLHQPHFDSVNAVDCARYVDWRLERQPPQ